MRRFVLGCGLVCVAAVSLAAARQAGHTAAKEFSPKDWFIDPAGRTGAIRRTTTRADLVRAYGSRNVADGPMDLGEGETTPATFLFPTDPAHRIAISWPDEKQQKIPVRIQIDGDSSVWNTTGAITLGTRLKRIEELNGGPFTLFGFGWDYSGTVASWQGGKLESAFEPRDRAWRVVVRLSPAGLDPNHVMSEAELAIQGERDFPSSHPEMQKLNPAVYQVIWSFHSPEPSSSPSPSPR